MMFDATKPPTCDADERFEFEQLFPTGRDTVRLEDFLPQGALPPDKQGSILARTGQD